MTLSEALKEIQTLNNNIELLKAQNLISQNEINTLRLLITSSLNEGSVSGPLRLQMVKFLQKTA